MSPDPLELVAAPSPFEAAIFDLDGLLIDSEPLWRKAEMEVFRSVGVELTEAECHQTTGLRTDQVTAYWLERRPWDAARFPAAEVTSRINDRVIELIVEHGTGKAGVDAAFNYLRSRGLRLGLASSSAMPVIEAAVRRLGIADRLEVVHSVDFEERSKPAPDVYLGAARRLGVDPSRCIAIEDSVVGLTAAKAAGMVCVWVPEHPPADIASGAPEPDAVLASLAEIGEGVWQQLVASRQSVSAADE